MLADTKHTLWKELIADATSEELSWMNGYLTGLLSASNKPDVQVTLPQVQAETKITIVYGTETGNAKGLSTRLAGIARKKGVIVKLQSLEQYKPQDLLKGGVLFIVISTQGDGEPPLSALPFYDHLHTLSSGLDKLKYAVLGLGDSSYPLFCKAGEDVDVQLEKAGAQRLLPLQKCDTDYEEDASLWLESVLQAVSNEQSGADVVFSSKAQVKKSGKKWYTGTVRQVINLNDTGSAKETYHIEIDAEDVDYAPGDSIGILPANREEVVQQVLRTTGIAAEKELPFKGDTLTVYELLKHKLNISYLPERVLQKYADITGQDIPLTKMALTDLLNIYPVAGDTQFEEILTVLEPIAPRLYSISSSPLAHEQEVHITVSRNTFSINSGKRFGLCSDYLAGLGEGTELTFYVHKNNLFRLPDEDKDIILIGPGTGIAPFRSFLAEREASGATGRSWLFFGEQHFVTDFLYQTEIQSWLDTGILQQVNVAFSRDQPERIYVQHKIEEHGARFYDWINAGAYLYICGAKEPMSVDVERSITRIVGQFGQKSEEEAAQYMEELRESGRLLKDVY